MTLTTVTRTGLHTEALDHVFTIGASGSSAYTFQGEGLNGTVNNPTLYLTRGKTYRFENGSGGHPIRIQSTSGASGTAYNTGVTNNAGSGTVIVEVQHDAPDVLYYQCTSHAAMNGILYIAGALADGSVTTAKIANGAVGGTQLNNNAVTTGKISNASVTSAKLADNAVTSAKILNGAVSEDKLGSSVISNTKLASGAVTNAKVASNAAIDGSKISPDFGSQNIVTTGDLTVSGGDITLNGTSCLLNFNDTNNNPDFRIQVESGNFLIEDATNSYADRFVISSTGNVGIGTSSPEEILHIHESSNNPCDFRISNSEGYGFLRSDSNLLAYNAQLHLFANRDRSTEYMRIDSSGNVGIGTTSPADKFHVKAGTQRNFVVRSTGGEPHLYAQNDSGNVENLMIGGNNVIFKAGSGSTGNEIARISENGGITFNGDTAAANGLDDYEEGTFNVTLPENGSGNQTITNNPAGRYTKIGSLVYAYIYAIMSGSPQNNSSGWQLGGLPYAANVGSFTHHGFGNIQYTAAYNYDVWRPLVNGNSRIYFHRVDGSGSSLLNSDVVSIGMQYFLIGVAYMV